MKTSLTRILILFLIFTHFSFAQYISNKKIVDPNKVPSFAISPLSIQLLGRPGQTLKSSITLITERFTDNQFFSIKLMDLGQIDGSSLTLVERGEGTQSCANWIQIDKEVYPKATDKVAIPFTINIPRDIKQNGDYFAYIDIGANPIRPKEQFVVLVKNHLPVKVRVTITGQATLRINPKELKYKAGNFRDPANLILIVKNEGYWKTYLEGDILVRGSSGQFVVQLPYASTGNPLEIYPGLEVEIPCKLKHSLDAGKYSAQVRLLMNKFGRAQSDFEFLVSNKRELKANFIQKREFDLVMNVRPTIIDLPMSPGAIRYPTIIVQNKNKIPIHVNLELKRATMEVNGTYTYLESKSEIPLEKIIEFQPQNATLESMQTLKVKTKITAPEDLTEILKSAFVLKVSATRIDGNSISEKDWQSLGLRELLINLYDARSKNATLKVTKFELTRSTPNHNPTAGIIRIKNEGGKTGRFWGRISIVRRSGEEIGYMDIGNINTPEIILPGLEREFRVNMPILDKGNFKFIAALDLNRRGNEKVYKEIEFRAIGVDLGSK